MGIITDVPTLREHIARVDGVLYALEHDDTEELTAFAPELIRMAREQFSGIYEFLDNLGKEREV